MSTEQWPIFSEEIKSQQIREQAQKGALNLAEIQHQNRHGNHMSSGLPQFCGDQPHAAFALRQTESALHFHTLALIPVILGLISCLIPLGSSQCRARESDSVLLAITEILTVSVDLVRQNTAGIMPFTLPEPFYHLL